jgi:hypothetical protein
LNALTDYIYAPRLCISSLGNEFSNTSVQVHAQNSLSESDSDDISINSTSHEEEETGAVKVVFNLPDPNNFPLSVFKSFQHM